MEKSTLHLMNDDFNHVLDVKNAIVDVCGFNIDDVDSIVIIAHMQGSCPIWDAEIAELEVMKEKFGEFGINTQITEVGGEPF